MRILRKSTSIPKQKVYLKNCIVSDMQVLCIHLAEIYSVAVGAWHKVGGGKPKTNNTTQNTETKAPTLMELEG